MDDSLVSELPNRLGVFSDSVKSTGELTPELVVTRRQCLDESLKRKVAPHLALGWVKQPSDGERDVVALYPLDESKEAVGSVLYDFDMTLVPVQTSKRTEVGIQGHYRLPEVFMGDSEVVWSWLFAHSGTLTNAFQRLYTGW